MRGFSRMVISILVPVAAAIGTIMPAHASEREAAAQALATQGSRHRVSRAAPGTGFSRSIWRDEASSSRRPSSTREIERTWPSPRQPVASSGSITGTPQSVASSGPVTGSGNPITATEDEPFSGTIATFLDSNPKDTSGTFTVTIDWGDNTATSGTVSGGDGSFTVSGTHTYADEATYGFTVTLRYAATGSVAAVTGSTAHVAEGDHIIVIPTTIAATEDQTFSGVVASFSDTTYIDNPPHDFTATISWGDGTTSLGAIAANPSLEDGGYDILGSHMWSQDDTYTVTVSLSDDPPSTLTGIQIVSTARVAESRDFTAQGGGMLDLQEGVPFSGRVATFADIGSSDAPSDYAASVDWGDGTAATSGTISGSAGHYSVSGNHTYVDEGTYTVTVTISETGVPFRIRATSTAMVNEMDILTGHVTLTSPSEGHTFSGPVALFSDANVTNTASDFTALIIWGDGTATSGTVSGGTGFFIVSGSHTYADEGNFSVSVILSDDGESTVTGIARADVTVAEADSLSGSLTSLHATEGQAISGAVATFTDTNAANAPADFSAIINWGDGASTTGTVSGSSGYYTVSGTHIYADEGSYPIAVTLRDDAPGTASATVRGNVSVAESDSLTGTGTSITPISGTSFAGAVATFSDTNRTNIASDFVARISWGDGTTSAGTVSGMNGSFTVRGNHTYTLPGRYTVTTILRDDAPGTARASATTTAVATVPRSSPGSVVTALGNTGCTAVVTLNTVSLSGSPSGTFFLRDERPGGSPCGPYRPGVITFASIAVDAVLCTSHNTASVYGRANAWTYPSTIGQTVTFRADAVITNEPGTFNGTVTMRASNGYTSGTIPEVVRILGC